jgi:hypothetical protein
MTAYERLVRLFLAEVDREVEAVAALGQGLVEVGA